VLCREFKVSCDSALFSKNILLDIKKVFVYSLATFVLERAGSTTGKSGPRPPREAAGRGLEDKERAT
jgi:hypothetical protein